MTETQDQVVMFCPGHAHLVFEDDHGASFVVCETEDGRKCRRCDVLVGSTPAPACGAGVTRHVCPKCRFIFWTLAPAADSEPEPDCAVGA